MIKFYIYIRMRQVGIMGIIEMDPDKEFISVVLIEPIYKFIIDLVRCDF